MGEYVDKAISTIITVVVSVGVSAAIWILANVAVSQVHQHWRRFYTAAFALGGFFAGVLVSGNRLTRFSGPADSWYGKLGYWIWLPLVCAVIAAIVGYVLGGTDDRTTRLLAGVGGLGAGGALVGFMFRDDWFPDFEILPIVAWPVIGAAVGIGLAVATSRDRLGLGLLGAAGGWLLGAWAMPDLGNDGNLAWTIVACTVPAALVGGRFALGSVPTASERSRFDISARAWIFLAPALLFVFAALVVPTVGTLLLSFQDRDAEEFVGIDNYESIFSDPNSFNVSNWSAMFTSRLFWLGVVLLGVFVVLGLRSRRTTGKMAELGSPSSGPLLAGAFFVTMAMLTTLRGTIFNNIWWVIVVTLFATGVGLLIAVLADNVAYEKVAKSLVFMPMALSLVGASVIWRLMYVARDSSSEQTGVMNALWVGLGRLSTGQEVDGTAIYFLMVTAGLMLSLGAIAARNWVRAAVIVIGTAVATLLVRFVWNALDGGGTRLLFGAFVTIILLGAIAWLVQAVRGENYGSGALALIATLLVGWFTIRYWGIIGGGVGGHAFGSDGAARPDAINFIQDPPFNNMWLMVVLIWIQTGFAMVILSAGLDAVPDEYIEAARVDGATEQQIFWRIKLPQVAPTIGVVVTTLIVLIMKVYDIVKVMTNGNFGTEVLANSMFREAFTNFNRGLGAALAMLIFVSVLPIMITNIRRMQQEN